MVAFGSARARACALLLSVSAVAITGAAFAAPVTITNNPPSATNLQAPNVTGGVGPVTFSGATFVNQGQVGAGRFTAGGRDFNNDTLGSFSGMTFLRETWRRNASTGAYSGAMFTLPDRGPNFSLSGFPGDFFSNYNGRLNRWNFTFSPYTGANLPQATASQNQMVLTPAGGFLFSDFTGQAFTGLEPGSNTLTQNGFLFGGPAAGLGAGKISLDAEAVARAPDGSFYVSDEYQAGIFRFSATGQLIGYIPATPALTPRVGGVVNFTTAAAVAGQTGRRLNQGLEGLTISPDGKTLWVMLQSAALQDSTLSNDALRTTTRLIGYDISVNPAPANPFAEYVMELPVLNRGNTNGTVTAGSASNRTAAQSEILALNGTQFLVLSRDGNGLGNDATAVGGNDGRPLVYKSILLIDTAAATNIANTARSNTASGKVTTTPGVIDPAIVPVTQVQLVNIINTSELARFGLNGLTGALTNPTTLSEKWEAMGLLPTLEEDKPQDVFLFVGNDNDFQTTNGQINGGMTNGTTTLTTYNSGFNNDNMFLVYRLTLPTYVDPLYFQAMMTGAPVVLAAAMETGQDLALGNAKAIEAELDAARRSGAADGTRLWGSLRYADIDPLLNGAAYTAEAIGGTVGISHAVSPFWTLGAAVSHQQSEADVDGGYEIEAAGTALSAYAAYVGGPAFLQGSLTGGWLDFDKIVRPAAFGLTATGATEGWMESAAVRAGYVPEMDGFALGPVASIKYAKVDVDGYLETGAAGGNILFPSQTADMILFAGGAEASGEVAENTLLVGGLFYNGQAGGGDRLALVKLASSSAALASQLVNVPELADDFLSFQIGLQSKGADALQWRVGYELQMGVKESSDKSHLATMAASYRF